MFSKSDCAFILADPFVIDMLARSTVYNLNKCIQNEILPRNCSELIFILRLLSLSLLAWEVMDSQANKEPKIDASLITEYLPNMAYFLTDFYEKLYDEAMTALTTQTTLGAASLLTSPNMLSSATSTPPKPLVHSTAINSNRTSPPIVLKISTKKLEIISSIKIQIVENELCSALLVYLIVACLEINDWVNLKVLLPALRYPNNNYAQFEKWFLFQFFNYLCEKTIVEQFKHDWFVTLVFDEFLFSIIKQKDEQLQQDQNNASSLVLVNNFYEQVYKLIEKIYPLYLSASNFNRIIEVIKPKNFHSSSMHIVYLKFKSKFEQATEIPATTTINTTQIGRASCRERV